jgi:hypothetical protein
VSRPPRLGKRWFLFTPAPRNVGDARGPAPPFSSRHGLSDVSSTLYSEPIVHRLFNYNNYLVINWFFNLIGGTGTSFVRTIS